MRRIVLGLLVVLVTSIVGVSPAWADTHKITGTMTMEQGSFHGPTGAACSAGDGYEDISPGVTVKVRDSRDKVIGVGSLHDGRYVPAGVTGFWYCAFPFAVKVADSSTYSVEISHRGSLTYTKRQLEKNGWKVRLTLGGG